MVELEDSSHGSVVDHSDDDLDLLKVVEKRIASGTGFASSGDQQVWKKNGDDNNKEKNVHQQQDVNQKPAGVEFVKTRYPQYDRKQLVKSYIEESSNGEENSEHSPHDDEVDLLKIVAGRIAQGQEQSIIDNNNNEEAAAAIAAASGVGLQEQQESSTDPTAINVATTATATATTSLTRQQNYHQAAHAQPGAYNEAPGEETTRNHSLRYSRLNRDQDESRPIVQQQQRYQEEEQHDDKEGDTTTTTTSAPRLSVATLVTTGDGEDLPVAQQLDDHQDRRRSSHPQGTKNPDLMSVETKQCLYVSVSLFIVVGIVITLIAVLVPSDRTGGGNSCVTKSSATSSPTTVEYPMTLFPKETVDAIVIGIENNNNDTTPQAQAYQWLIKDPSPLQTYPDWRIVQRLVLATMYFSLGGPNWRNNTHWLDYQHHECDWFVSPPAYVCQFPMAADPCTEFEQITIPCGTNFSSSSSSSSSMTSNSSSDTTTTAAAAAAAATDTNEYGQYQGLWFTFNQLSGTLPPELYLLTSLSSLVIFGNSLTGTISNNIGKLSRLQKIILAANGGLTGSLPSAVFGSLSNLDELVLLSNQITGTVPTQIGVATNLKHVVMDANQVTGTFPSQVGLCTTLQHFLLGTNLVTGTIPTQIGELTSLVQLGIEINPMRSTIPTELGVLSQLEFFVSYSNGLHGTIPTELGLVTSLQDAIMDTNDLTSTIPTEIFQPEKLWNLRLNNNHLSGTIPSEAGLSKWLRSLYLHNNNLVSAIPTELGGMSTALVLKLSSNSLSGPIPSEIGSIADLEFLWLHNNSLTGTVPHELASLAALNNESQVFLQNNIISGIIPERLCMVSAGLTFDCSPSLCGCDCDCRNNTVNGSPAEDVTN